MSLTLRTTCKTAMAQAIITDAGAGCKLKLYNGTKPAALGAVTGGNTLLATLTNSTGLGSASAGAVDIDEAGFSQNNASHVNGTPTFARLTKADDTVVADVDIAAGAGNWQFSGTVATGQNVTLTGLSFTVGN